MLLRIVSKSVLLHKACSLISHQVRHNHLSRISSILGNFAHFPHDIRNISNINEDEDLDQENFYHVYQLANKYLSHDTSKKDTLMSKIDTFDEIQQVVECIENDLNVLNKDHIIQLLLLTGKLRDKQDLTVIKNLKEFAEKISTKLSEMNDIELGITLLHLRLLGINSRHPVMQKIINSIMDSINQKKDDFDSLALSLFTETMCLERDLYSKLLMVETLPIINTKLNDCNDPVEFYHLISCLNSVHPVLSSESLNVYKEKIEEFIDKNLITSDHVRIIFKTINFLNFPHWSTANAKLIQKFLIILQKSVPNMQPKDLFQTNRALFVQYEPSKLIPLLRDRANKLLEETKDVELLQIACLYCTPQERIKFVEMLRDKVLKYQTTLGPASDSLASFFKILRLLKISDTELCDCFWTKIVNKIFSLPEPELRHRLPKYFHRYMNFNNNLGGTYRHIEFEKIVYEYCVEEMKTGSAYIPKEFSKFASFVIAYSDKYDSIPPFVIEKLIMMQEQLNIIDCKLISRGLEILHGFRPRRHINRDLLDNQMEILQYILDSCAQRHLEAGNLSIKDVNIILSSYVRRRAPRDSSLFFEIMGWYDQKLELNSRTIREICHSLQVSKFCNDSVCDQFFDYVVDNKDIVTGETVEKILTTCYNLSYFPENPEALETCSDIVFRDFNVMSGLSVVQALLAMTFYKSAPAELISLVFNGDFIKRLEQEVQMAYSRDTYPQKVMSLVMQLNRAVCLDHPEYNIRWFQQSFVEAQMSKKPKSVSHVVLFTYKKYSRRKVMEVTNIELEEEIKARERLGSCEVCSQNQAKYTCPKCELHTCSLNCSKIHKKELECDGIRDKTKYIPLKKMTPLDFMNDYYFLEEATRFTKEIKTNWKVKSTKKLSNKFVKLKKAAQQRNIKLFLLNSSLNKRKKNLSFHDPKADAITWHVELNFVNADFKTRLKVNENTKIIDTIQSIIDKDENKQLEFYKAQGMSRLKVLLKAEGLKRNQNRYFDLDVKKSLKSNLSGKVVIEYPSISVVMDHCIDGYELIMSDDESIQSEQKEFVKTLQEEVFTRKVGENPMFILKPEEVPIFADVLNDDNQKQAENSGNPQQSPNKSVITTKDIDAKIDDDEEISPQNYFF